MVAQACQTEERAFTEQLDAVHREAAQKGRELRRVQETVRTLRAELEQEKIMGQQYRGEVEDLEAQLSRSLQKEQHADRERALAEWRLRNAEAAPGLGQSGRPSTSSRLSRSCTPQPGAARVMKAWAESGSGRNTPRCQETATAGNAMQDSGLMVQSSPSTARPPVPMESTQRGSVDSIGVSDSEDEDDEAAVEESVSSNGDEDLLVFHPPPSRAGMARDTDMPARFGGPSATSARR